MLIALLLPRLALGFLAAGALAACQTTASVEDARSARLAAFNGATLAQFSAATGLTPVDMYPIEGGRVFVFDGPTVVSTLPATQWTPAISRTSGCRLLVATRPNGASGTADSWIITGTTRTGPCQTLPI